MSIDTETEYVYIPKSTLISKGISDEHALTPEEAAKIVVNRKIIAKFIRQKAIDLQFSIWEWRFKGQEQLSLEVVKTLSEIAIWVESMKDRFEEFVEKKRKDDQIEEERKKAAEEEKKKK